MSAGVPPATDAADRLLAFETGGEHKGVDAGALASRIHAKLRLHLAPVIGDMGFDALFARAVKLAKPDMPALRDVDTSSDANTAVEQLCATLRQAVPGEGQGAVSAVVSTFVNLLSTFIGEGLTWKLLRNAWPEALPTEPPSGEKP